MNFLVRLITTALIAAVAFVAVPATAAHADPCRGLSCPVPAECEGIVCPTPVEECQGLTCPARVAPCNVDFGAQALRDAATAASASRIADLTAETSTLHALVASKDKQISAGAAKIARLQAKVQQLRERLRSR